MASEGHENPSIASALGISRNKAARWRGRYADRHGAALDGLASPAGSGIDSWLGLAGRAATGDWIGAGLGAVSLLLGGGSGAYALRQRRRARQMESDAADLAEMPPDLARAEAARRGIRGRAITG